MSSISLGRMVTLPPFVTQILKIVVAIIDIGNKNFYIQDASDEALLARLERYDTLITARDNANIARLKAEAARLAAQAEASA